MDGPKTLYQKLWDAHVVKDYGDGTALLYVDRQILHEVSTPVSFRTMEDAGRTMRRPRAHIAVADHAVPTRSLHVSAKDLALALIAQIGANGAAGHCIEYCGPVIDAMEMSELMTLCNMSIEAGARIGLIAPDETTFAYLAGRPMAPEDSIFAQAKDHWRTLKSDPNASFDRNVEIDITGLTPLVTWGTSPEDAAPIGERIPDPAAMADEGRKARARKALVYMGFQGGRRVEGITITTVFIGSCSNVHMDDPRAAADMIKGRRVADGVRAIVVPGSSAVPAQAEAEELDAAFLNAGFEWRHAGCSMCVAMNGDVLQPGERCASTSNRNFAGRQGRDGNAHLMSRAMAAAAAVTGRICDVPRLPSLQVGA